MLSLQCNINIRSGEPLLDFWKGSSMKELKQWIEDVLSPLGCHLYELEWLTNERPPLLRISIEKENGEVDLDTCVTCSDAIGTMLDEKDWYGKEYNLEVCSPGAERELKTEEQIQNAVGSYVYVKLKDPKQGLSQVLGDLIAVNDETVTISYREKTRTKTIEIDKNNMDVIMTAVKI